jgi:hypothetical protein
MLVIMSSMLYTSVRIKPQMKLSAFILETDGQIPGGNQSKTRANRRHDNGEQRRGNYGLREPTRRGHRNVIVPSASLDAPHFPGIF